MAWLEDESPLRELRVQRGMRVDEVVDQLSTDLELEPEHQGKLRRYFQRLERGALDVRRVDARVFESLAHSLQFSPSALRSWANTPRRGLLEAAPAFRDERQTKTTPAVPRAAAEEWDELDELFIGPRAGTSSRGRAVPQSRCPDRSTVVFASAAPGIYGVEKYAKTLRRVVERKGIETRFCSRNGGSRSSTGRGCSAARA